jgi:hypothetical protein
MVQRILHNGHIVTLNTQQPHASALAIDFGRVVAIGRDEDILPLQRPHTIIENLAGKNAHTGFKPMPTFTGNGYRVPCNLLIYLKCPAKPKP